VRPLFPRFYFATVFGARKRMEKSVVVIIFFIIIINYTRVYVTLLPLLLSQNDATRVCASTLATRHE
jgi:hypothetical protein|tara:strand:- start:1759 stop:1959 length:201 start_codon:yes stop_codon:yes gene_type:complete